MKCYECTGYFDAYLNKKLDKKKTSEFSEHIKTCEKCREEYNLYSAYFGTAKIEDDFFVPKNLDAKIIYKLNNLKEAKKPLFKFGTKKILAYATSLSFLFLIAFFGANYINTINQIRDTASNIDTPAPLGTPEKTPEPAQHQIAASPEIINEKPEKTPAPVVSTPIPSSAPKDVIIQAPVPTEAPASNIQTPSPAPVTTSAPTLSPSPEQKADVDTMQKKASENILETNENTQILMAPFAAIISEPESSADQHVSDSSPAPPARSGSLAGGGGTSVSMSTTAPASTASYNTLASSSLKSDILAKYSCTDLGNEIYEIDISSNEILVNFPDITIISDSDKVIIKFN